MPSSTTLTLTLSSIPASIIMSRLIAYGIFLVGLFYALTTLGVRVGPLLGALARPLGGWLSDRLGGGKVTLWTFAVMLAASVAVLGAMLKGVDITTSNVPGPPFPMFMAGAKVEEFYAFGPLAGAAINITLFSYDGTVHLGLNVDRAAVVDQDLFARCVCEAIDETLTLGPS